MNLVRCEKGQHFYDKDKFTSCPHCAENTDDREVTVALRSEQSSVSEANAVEIQNVSVGSNQTISLKDALVASQTSVLEEDDDMGKTVRFYDKELGTEPVVGWLIGLNGAVFGQSFVLKSGKNFIGRGKDMDVVLEKDNTVSRSKHAIIVYEPRSKMFIAQPGESRELFYVNEQVILNNEQLHKNDIIYIGDTKLMLIPCCDEAFCWEDVKDEK